ncbi:nuclear transcription factor Y subunit A-3-like isoform X2 [Cornus florida]|uniref:nuclear transcription factor Y subunit A-3-like isoform X2 n=1 Tax=Cornus florida TaxID=4283 RepID=UPI00289CB45E|nr:nuclear transcription factor Y subunit A-3-like isoform X2 [Cornus florida]
MPIQVHNLPNKSFGRSPIHAMSYFSLNCPSWRNSHEHQLHESLSKNSSLEVESPPRHRKEAKRLGFQLQNQNSSSSQSTDQSHQEVTVIGGTNSQAQCISSESDQDKSHGKRIEDQMKPVFLMANPDLVINPSQVDIRHTMSCIPHNYADPCFTGLYTAYGPQAIPQMVGIAPARVPLPPELSEDGPIYVNAKQYHGILRRRQTRARLEAQNKLVKNRKPYLHESRHLHALNRVRGSGGRFLSTKKLQQSEQSPTTNSHYPSGSRHFCQKGYMSQFDNHQSESSTSVTNTDVHLQQQDHRFSVISPHMGVTVAGNGSLMCNGTWPRAPVVR